MVRLVFFLLAILAALPASAQPRPNAIQPELVLRGPAVPGAGTDMAILMKTKEGWHGYWENPGDAGLPMSVEWDLPEGWEVDELRYPVPQTMLVAGIVNYVYKGDYAVLTRIIPPKDPGRSNLVRAKMRWLACTDKICVPEEGEVSINVSTGGMSVPDQRFDDWLQALPQPLSSEARFAVDGGIVSIALPIPEEIDVGAPYLFPLDDGPIDYAGPQTFRRTGDWLVAELKHRKGSPETLSGVLALGDGRGLSFEAVPGAIPTGGRMLGAPGQGAMWAAIAGAILGGLLLNLMPCVFPILALKALHLAKAGGSESEARREALSYTAGAIIGTGALGGLLLVLRASGEAAGWAFQLQDPRTIVVLMLLATAITLNLLKVFELPVLAGEVSNAGSFGTGALAAFVATPCAGPFLGVALGTALLLPPAGSIAVFAALGFGLALPFILIAFVPALRKRLPKPGPWMARFQRILAVPMGLTALATLWLLWRLGGMTGLIVGVGASAALILLLWLLGRAQQRGRGIGLAALAGTLGVAALAAVAVPSTPTAASRTAHSDPTWSYDAVRQARAEQKPVFVYFTADWCLSCKANESVAINRDSARDAFEQAGVVVLVGDWTDGDPQITRFLESQGRAGVPYYLWYAPGAREPEELPQILTPSMLIERAEAAKPKREADETADYSAE